MITLITGGQSIQRKALMSSLTSSMPNYNTTSYNFFNLVFFQEVGDWCYEDFNDVYFIISHKSSDFQVVIHETEKSNVKTFDKHFHLVETYENLYVYEFDKVATDLDNAQTLRNAKKWVFNPHYAHVALVPYVNDKLFRSFKTLCFFAFMFSLFYSIYAILFIKENSSTHIINALYIAVFCASSLMAFTTFKKVAYE